MHGIQDALDEVERTLERLESFAARLRVAKYRLLLGLREMEGRPRSRDARLARAALADPFDMAAFMAIQSEPRDPPLQQEQRAAGETL